MAQTLAVLLGRHGALELLASLHGPDNILCGLDSILSGPEAVLCGSDGLLCGPDSILHGAHGIFMAQTAFCVAETDRILFGPNGILWVLVSDSRPIDSMGDRASAGRILCINALLDAAAVADVTVTIVVANVAVTVAAAAVLAAAVGNPEALG